jgi:hypothetical protein
MTDVRRNALNQSLFREVNERIRALTSDDRDSTPLTLICECGSTGCTAAITISVGAYEAVRSDPVHFIIAPRHENLAVESIVEERRGYTVVRNDGLASRVARQTYTR